MKYNTLAKLVTLFMALAWTANALPPHIDGAQGISPRDDPDYWPAKGINCDGNFGCAGGYCPPDSTTIKKIVDQVRKWILSELYMNIYVACARCATQEERPADYMQGICVYATKLKGNQTVTGKVVKDSVNALIKHDCGRCGSVPIVPGAKNDTDGNVQINFTRGACETGLCQGNGYDSTGKSSSNTESASQAESAPTEDESSKQSFPVLNTSPRSAAPDSASSLLGINCRGSGRCSGTCGRNIYELKAYFAKLDAWKNNNYRNGEQIACLKCKGMPDGICAWATNLPEGAYLDMTPAQEALDNLIKHGCTGCGSIPLYPGNDVKKGALVVNFTAEEVCGEGICTRYSNSKASS